MTLQSGIAIAPDADVWAADPETDRIKCPGAGRLQFRAVEGAGGTGTAKIEAFAHAANSGGTPEAIPFRHKTAQTPGELDDSGGFTTAAAAGVTPAAGADKQTLIEFRADELPAGKPYVSLKFTEVEDSPVDGAVMWTIKGGDYPGSGNTSL